ncbi:MAG: hypothetical protein IH983_08995 [Planctomycetes bacterium]|nr:hypothetical protein [Planctomycetota bacterium]
MKRRYVCTNGGARWAALVSLGIIFAAVFSAYANREASKPSMPPDGVAAGTPASRAAVAAANGSGGGIAGCPASSCVGGDCTLTQSLDTVTDAGNQVACAADVGTTPNGWARCYNLVNEGVPAGQNLTINSVTFGVAQATINGINIDVVLYLDCNGCPPVEPGVDAEVLASQSLVVNMADVGSMITVEFPAGTVVPAGSDLIVEIVSVDDGTVPPEFFFRAMSNDGGQCGPSYIRAPDGDCGLTGWTDLADVEPGFPDAHLIQVISATVGGVVTVECSKVPEACGKGAGPCDMPHNMPGCDDVDCCAAVCNINPACCSQQWDALCVQIASKLLDCQVSGDPVFIATGPSSSLDGYLDVSPDVFGSYASATFGGQADHYNPAGQAGLQEAAFSSGLYLFVGDTQRELLSANDQWQGVFPGDPSLDTIVTAANSASDTNGDGVNDTLTSGFNVSGGDTDLSFDVTQHVERIVPLGGNPVAILTQDYTITNNSTLPIAFELVSTFDGDLLWDPDGDFTDDSVGTGTNGSPALDRFVFEQEEADPTTAITISSPTGDAYAGSKGGINPDPGDPDCVPYGFGTDVQVWDAFGIPDCWRNHIAGIGYDTDGESGVDPDPANCDPCDGLALLEIPVSLAAGASTTVTVTHTYGANAPVGGGLPCPWDLNGSGDVGILDLLALLAAWGPNPGDPADFDGNGTVDIFDLLTLIANWGACP